MCAGDEFVQVNHVTTYDPSKREMKKRSSSVIKKLDFNFEKLSIGTSYYQEGLDSKVLI